MGTTSNRAFVSKIPANYVEATISHLLPSEVEIQRLDQAQLIALHKKITEYRRLIKADPVRFYKPNPGGQWDFMTLDDPTIRVLMFLAGNKSGKTTAGAIRMAEAMTGTMLWGHDWRKPISFPTPRYGCVFAEDFDSHTEVTLPAYLSWCPKKYIKNIVRNPAGHVVRIEHTNGSILFFRTYDQGSDKSEGKDWHIVWCDEPPPRSIYTAIFRGLVTLDGLLMITATLLKETWLFDEADKPFVRIFQGTIFDNSWISTAARDDLISTLNDEERDVRVSGKPISLVGVIYKEFQDQPPFIIPEQEFNSEWPIVMGLDPHERKPCYHLWTTITPDNELIIFDWALLKGDLNTIKAELEAIESRHWAPSRLVVMDPNRGRAKQINEQSWEQVYEEWGFQVLLGNDDLKIGHTMVHTYLQAKPKPRLRFTENCRGKGGPVYSLLRYAWDNWARSRGYSEKSVKEKPKDLNKDFADIIRYFCM